MYRFDVVIHACGPEVVAGEAVNLSERPVQTLAVPLGTLARRLPVSFDEAVERLEKLPRMFVEPDGALVWRGEDASFGPWQVDGQLEDGGAELFHVQIKGDCPQSDFDKLLTSFGWPAGPVMFQLRLTGVFVDETEFRRLAAL